MTRTCDPPVCVHVSPIIQRKSAGVGAAAELHLVQHLPSNCWSNSGQCRGGHMTPLHKIGSALLFMPTPPERPAANDLSSGTFVASDQHRGQQVPISSAFLYTNGFSQARSLHVMPSHVSTFSPAFGA